MKISIIICALALTCSAAPADEGSNKCALCSNFVDIMNAGELESIPSEYEEFFDEDNLASCLASCNTEYSLEADSNSLASNTVELLSMVGCTTCREMIQGVISHLYGFDYATIKRAVKNSCSALDGIMKTGRCKLFIKSRLEEIVEAVFHYHMDAQAACIKLKQC